MSNEDRNKSEQIINDFPKWSRPMSTIESNLVDRYWELRMNESYYDSHLQMWDETTESKLAGVLGCGANAIVL